MKKMLFIALALSGALAGALAGCKQGVGERCQVNDDCASPLVCNQAKMQCQDTGGVNNIDATVPDAPFTTGDAHATDAALDATPADAAVD